MSNVLSEQFAGRRQAKCESKGYQKPLDLLREPQGLLMASPPSGRRSTLQPHTDHGIVVE
jgi:hypothetical protein